ncbi:MAG: hypothetical protein ACLRMZ_15555 [Blautia marasmi]
MQERWEEIKLEILKVRQGADSSTLYRLSEEYFELADQSVGVAEQYAEGYVRMAQICFAALTLICTAAAIFLAFYMKQQEKRRKAVALMENANLEKSRKLSRMTEDIQAPMNEISELLYVSDVDTYELLFINEAGKRSFRIDDVEGNSAIRYYREEIPLSVLHHQISEKRRELYLGNHQSHHRPALPAQRPSDRVGWKTGAPGTGF